MNKERKVIDNAIVVFNKKKVKARDLKQLRDFKGDIVINGELKCNNNIYLQCENLYVHSIRADKYDSKDIFVAGNLIVEGDIMCWKLNVDGAIYCKGDIDSISINVLEDLYAGKIDAHNSDIVVGGNLVCDQIKACNELSVLGKTRCKTTIEADCFELRGRVSTKGIRNYQL